MRSSPLIVWMVMALALASQAFGQIPPPYLAPNDVAPANAPSTIVVVGREEPGDRLIVTGRITDSRTGKSLGGVSVYVFHTDKKGLYTAAGGRNSDENARLHGVMRTDADGRYQFETIRPGGYPQGGSPAHVHYVLNAPGYKPRMFELWFDDDAILAEWRKAGKPDVPTGYPPDAVEVRPVTRDTAGVWHAIRDMKLSPQ